MASKADQRRLLEKLERKFPSLKQRILKNKAAILDAWKFVENCNAEEFGYDRAKEEISIIICETRDSFTNNTCLAWNLTIMVNPWLLPFLLPSGAIFYVRFLMNG